MAEKVCLDTDACIAILKGDPKAEKLGNLIGKNDMCVASVTVFELYLRKNNLQEVDNFLDGIPVISFDNNSALKASAIYKELKSKGRLIGIEDVLIASAAISNNCRLATFNKKHFSNINGLRLLVLN